MPSEKPAEKGNFLEPIWPNRFRGPVSKGDKMAGESTHEQPIFVLGTTRSGTTLLSLILGHHSEIVFVGELQWVFDFSGAEDPQCMNEYYAWLDKNRFFHAHRPNLDRSLTFPDLARSFLHQMTESVADSEPF
jgi:hypothetical protein